jgi:hypothetical protein
VKRIPEVGQIKNPGLLDHGKPGQDILSNGLASRIMHEQVGCGGVRDKHVDEAVDIFGCLRKRFPCNSIRHNGIVGVRGSSPLGSTILQGQGEIQEFVLWFLLQPDSRIWYSGTNNYFALVYMLGNF